MGGTGDRLDLIGGCLRAEVPDGRGGVEGSSGDVPKDRFKLCERTVGGGPGGGGGSGIPGSHAACVVSLRSGRCQAETLCAPIPPVEAALLEAGGRSAVSMA